MTQRQERQHPVLQPELQPCLRSNRTTLEKQTVLMNRIKFLREPQKEAKQSMRPVRYKREMELKL